MRVAAGMQVSWVDAGRHGSERTMARVVVAVAPGLVFVVTGRVMVTGVVFHVGSVSPFRGQG